MDPERILSFSEPEIGLEAVLVIDSTTLGPAAGGIRTKPYASLADATADARKLARAMTLKCSLAGLEAGGGKAVLLQQEGWDRQAVFARFGEIVQSLAGDFRTAGDLGTTEADLQAMATTCEYVHTGEQALSQAVARGVVACMHALASTKGHTLDTLHVAIQGCGAIGSAVAATLASQCASLAVTDVLASRAQRVHNDHRASILAPEEFLRASVDVLSPCAMGSVLGTNNIDRLQAWGVCGAANNIVLDAEAEEALHKRAILVVPDVVSSAGAVIDGIGATVMGLSHTRRIQLIDALGSTANHILSESAKLDKTSQQVAEALAMATL